MAVSVFLLLFFSGFAVTLTTEYIFIDTPMKWADANKYCTQNHGGLAIISNDKEDEKIKFNGIWSWIGLYRSPNNSDVWLWSNGHPNIFFKWAEHQPNDFHGIQDCVSIASGGWNDLSCGKHLSFHCNKFPAILVNEKKPWEVALHYCRAFYISLASVSQLYLHGDDIEQIRADSVWTGLHFLNGNWCWVSRERLWIPESLPSCPVQSYRCGAYNFKSNAWENRNCNEELDFVCYRDKLE